MSEVAKLHNEAPPGTLKTKVSMSMKVTRAHDGSVEDYGTQYTKVVELDYRTAISLLGQEAADQLFRGAERDNDESD